MLCVTSMMVSTMSLQAIRLNAATGDVSEAVELDDEGDTVASEETSIDSELQQMEEARKEEEAQWHEEAQGRQKQRTDTEPIVEHESLVVAEEDKISEEAEQTKRPEFGTYSVIGSKRIVEIFPDPVLAKVVAKELGRTNTQAQVTQAELNGVKYVRDYVAQAGKVQNLEGLQYLPELSNLVLTNGQISDISALSNLTNLTYLSLNDNKISDISALSSLTSLRELYLYNNKISDISALSSLTSLRELYLYNNKISDISALQNLTVLEIVRLESNQISDISALSNLTTLTSLDLDTNQISDISALSNLTTLTSLDIYNNQISDISTLKNLTALKSLNLKNTKISDISALSSLTSLRYLYLGNNKINDISALKNLTALESVRLESNQISDISALSNLTNLAYLNMDTNKISDISALSNLTTLTSLNLDSNKINDIGALKRLTNLDTLYLNSNQISDISALSNLTNLTYLNMNYNKISDISALSSLTSLRYLYLGNNKISDISALNKLTNLIGLYLNNNRVNDISALSTLTKLTYFNGEQNQISDISMLKNLTKLKNLSMESNEITDISPLFKLTNLESVYLSNNQIVDVTALKNVQLPNLHYLILRNQSNKIIPTIEYTGKIQVENTIKDIDGNLIAPENFSPTDNVAYNSPYVTWTIPKPSGESEVSYSWDKEMQVGNTGVYYSGTYHTKVIASPNYMVTYNIDGKVRTEERAIGEPLRKPSNPVKRGYRFIGWYTAPSGGQKWDFAVDKMLESDLTLYARFEIKTYQVTYNNGESLFVLMFDFGSKLSEPVMLPKSGVTFTGWYTEQVGGKEWDFAEDTMPANDMTLHARFTVNKYQLTYDNDGPMFVMDLKFGSKLIEPAMTPKNGAAFMGWYTERSGGKQWDFAEDTMPAADLTLYARYEEPGCKPGTYRVELEVDGEIISKTCARSNTEIEKPKDPVKPGYAFVGWYPQEKGGKKWVFKRDMMPAHDVTLYARFKQAGAFSVDVHETAVARRNDVVETAGSL